MVKLKPETEQEFENYIDKNKNDNSMDTYVDKITRAYYDKQAKRTLGYTLSELQSTIDNAIIGFYSDAKFSIEKIAETLSLEPKYVRKVLRSHDLLKK